MANTQSSQSGKMYQVRRVQRLGVTFKPCLLQSHDHTVLFVPCLQICEKHNLPFTMLVFSFADLLEAKQWAVDTQKGRRNLDKWELGQIALKLNPEIEARARANQGTRTDLSVNSPKG